MKSLLAPALCLALFQATPGPEDVNGSITGIVIQAGTDQPIDAVQIIMTPANASGGPPGLNTIQTYTDLRGRFTIANIKPGRYRMQWQRSGFSTPPVGTPATEKSVVESLKVQLDVEKVLMPTPLSAASVLVDVAPQQRIAGFAFFLTAGGVISGRLTDPMGMPLVNATMTALAVNYEDGHRVLRPAGGVVESDDRGYFRLYGLRPGEFYVRADWRTNGINSGEPSHTYFPGVSEVSTAVPITVNEKSESPDANFSIPSAGGIRISGTVSGHSRSVQANVQFYLLPGRSRILDDPGGFSRINQRTGAADRVSGAFEIRAVPQGNYELYAVYYDNDQMKVFMGHVPVYPGSQDLENVAIVMQPAVSLNGRIVLEDGTPLRTTIATRARDIAASLSRTPGGATSNADGTFVLPQVHEGRYSLTLTATDKCIVDIQQDGRTVYDSGISIEESTSPLNIIASSRCGTIQTEVVDEMQRPVKGAFVALVPSKERRHNPLLFRRSPYDASASRYVPIEQIPPGEYTLFAWDKIPTYAEMDPEYLARYEDRGVVVRVGPESNLKVEIPLIDTKR